MVLVLETHLDDGLTTNEAMERRERFGPNELPVIQRHGPLVGFLLQFHNPLIYVLLLAIVVTVSIGHLVDALVIAGVVLINAIVGFLQEQRATKSLQALTSLTRTQTHVVRDGVVHRIDSLDLVPGDVVQLEQGDKVPADLRITYARELFVDESALTGESEAVHKEPMVLPAATVLADRLNMAYSGTLVTAGSARGLVVETGLSTEIGRIHQLIGSAAGVQTPLTQRLTVFSRWLTLIIVILAAITFVIGLARGESGGEMLTAAVALAVGAIPEGLPAAVTIVLAIGVSRMATRHAIIRKLPAAESLGSTTVICTDKTGTLTWNRMTVREVFAGRGSYPLAEGPLDVMRPCLVAGVLCTHASIRLDAVGDPVATGEPTETALLLAAQSRGIDQGALLREWPCVDERPFSSETRRMVTMHRHVSTGEHLVVVKGATEAVLPLCDRRLLSDGTEAPLDAFTVEAQAAEYSQRALRVLAFGWATVESSWSLSDEETPTLTFLGLQAMEDPLRPESARAVASCQRAGIIVKMITGDHPRTAAAIAEQAGLSRAPGKAPIVATGADLSEADDETFANLVQRVDVFARVSADQKLRIVEALQHAGHVVAMTGDGINDAPALKQADIGIAMGYGGTEVAKDAAAMVLADDNFASIEAAVEEGRSIYDNLVKFITWTLPTNIGEGLVILVAITLGVALPITPVQILWINMTTAVALGLMLAFEPAEPNVMDRPPRAPSQPILTRQLMVRIGLVGMLMLVGAFSIHELTLGSGATIDQARTAAVNAFVAMEIGYLWNCRVLQGSVFTVGLFANRLLILGVAVMIALQVLFTYTPWMQALFGTAAISGSTWIAIVLVGVAMTAIVAVTKRWSRGHRSAEWRSHRISDCRESQQLDI